jgi:protein-disulfide isomerase
LQKLNELYIETGKVNVELIFVNFPASQFEKAKINFLFSEADNHIKLKFLTEKSDSAFLFNCIENFPLSDIKKKINHNDSIIRLNGINHFPTFILNNERKITGLASFNEFNAIFRSCLDKESATEL